MSPLVEIGLIDLTKSGCAMAHPGATGLSNASGYAPRSALGTLDYNPL